MSFRLGLKKDANDYRTDSFLHLMQVLPKYEKSLIERRAERLMCRNPMSRVKKLPGHVLVENVKGFESSRVRQVLVETLKRCGYDYQEWLLSPNQLNVPNSRLRYYLTAKHNKSLTFKSNDGQVLTEVPKLDTKMLCRFCSSELFESEDRSVRPLKEYLQDLNDKQSEPYLLSDKVLEKYFMILDIVKSDSLNTNCFTKGYSHLIEGAGSVLQTKNCDIKRIVSDLNSCQTVEQKICLLRRLGLRFFTWREIANLMCFPDYFGESDHTFSEFSLNISNIKPFIHQNITSNHLKYKELSFHSTNQWIRCRLSRQLYPQTEVPFIRKLSERQSNRVFVKITVK